ncbi:cupin domain-containing protein [Piscinibacter sp.]|uniref:cupin domain-containing protein n=1 Tax=Piscinibacter sp. TaxID=1903157 RepID=UPI002C7AC590|nr:cupin domain-containing protein [Albitalea sp.]HUG24227.1 cupin domain-containing protein [Albitalea sp.]
MIVRKDEPAVERESSEAFGTVDTKRYSDAGGITQYGGYVQTLQPGARSSDRHWHEEEDEFLYVLSGELTVTENDGEKILRPGDAACWPAGVPNAHHVSNRSNAPCSYLIVGTRVTHDVCHYPDLGRTLYTEGDVWRIEDADGQVIKSGRV